MVGIFLYNIPFNKTTQPLQSVSIPYTKELNAWLKEQKIILSIPETIGAIRNRWLSPYMLVTSQWQQWNLFSPDPIRRVTHYAIEIEDQYTGQWSELARITPKTVPWHLRAVYMKALNTIYQQEKWPIRIMFIRRFCDIFNIPKNANIRLRVHYYVLPLLEEKMTIQQWRDYKPHWEQYEDVFTHCSPILKPPA